MRGVSSAKEPDSSFGGMSVVNCLGFVHMEEEVHNRVQVEQEEKSKG